MRPTQHNHTNNVPGNSFELAHHPRRVPKHRNSTGSLTGKYPIILDDGRTIIYVSDKNKENEIRSKYSLKKF